MPIQGQNVIKEFGQPPTRVLHGLSFQIQDGEFVAISGRSGSGKSTLLYLASTLDTPTRGEIFIDDQNIRNMSVSQVHRFRNLHIGFVFQFHYLLPELTAIENILLPTKQLGQQAGFFEDAMNWLKHFRMQDKAKRLPSQLSGGEQQRVAIIRSLILKPKYIFADEPTGNLDTINAHMVMDVLKHINQTQKTTIVLVTHEPKFAQMAQREIYLIDGKISKREDDRF